MFHYLVTCAVVVANLSSNMESKPKEHVSFFQKADKINGKGETGVSYSDARTSALYSCLDSAEVRENGESKMKEGIVTYKFHKRRMVCRKVIQSCVNQLSHYLIISVLNKMVSSPENRIPRSPASDLLLLAYSHLTSVLAVSSPASLPTSPAGSH